MEDYRYISNCSSIGSDQDMIGSDILSSYESFSPEDKVEFLELMKIKSIEEYLINSGRKYSSKISIEDYVEYRIHKLLLLFCPPIIFIIGIVGNTLSFVILSQRAMRLVSTYAYLTVLTFADSMVLFVGLLRIWITELTEWDFRLWSQWSCKLTNVVGTTVSDYSGWLIIAVTAERFLAVCYPFKAPMVCSRKRAYIIMTVLLIFQLLFNLHLFWTTELIYKQNCGVVDVHCDPSSDFKYLVQEVWPWVDAVMYSFIPFVVILVLNILIIRKVVLSRRQRDSQLCRGMMTATEKSARMSVMLLTISFAFLIMTLPMNITLIVTNLVQFEVRGKAKMKLGRTVTELLMYINHSMNFFLYCSTGQKFRQELCAIVCGGSRRMKQRTVTSQHSENAMMKMSARNIFEQQRT